MELARGETRQSCNKHATEPLAYEIQTNRLRGNGQSPARGGWFV